MSKILVIAEKPSVARDIARVLNCRDRVDGALQSSTHIVSWAIGHLVTLCEPDDLSPVYKKWKMETLPILPENIPTKVVPKTASQFHLLKSFMLNPDVSSIICATDSGREGELIFRYIYHQAGCTKPVQRLWISSMTDSAIREGLEALKPSAHYDSLYESALCRSQADWLVGMNATRAFTIHYDALLSLGRVQTPSLNLIVQRDNEISAFVPKDYHEVRADFGDYQGLWLDTEKNETRCYDPELAQKIKKECTGQPGTVTHSTREHKKTAPPPLFDLTSLQREANRLMGLSAAKTLEVAQSLYEQYKLITYPRTDSRYLPKDMIPQVKKVLRALPEPYAELSAPILEVPTPFGRVINDSKVTDHHAIIPTGHKADLSKLPEVERKLFDMIARRLIAVHYPDYEYESTKILTKVLDHIFQTTGTMPLVPGWKALYQDEPAEATDLPRLAVGDERTCKSVTLKKLKTKPPAPLTDASLLQMMERAGKLIDDEALQESMKDSGLGTPATRAATIERLIQVGYVQRRGKTVISTEKGRMLMQVVPEQIRSAEMTGRWERALTGMAREQDPERLKERSEKFMQSIHRYANYLVDAAKAAPTEVKFEREAGKKQNSHVKSLKKPCPLCGQGEVTINTHAFSCSRWRDGCKYTVWLNMFDRQGGPTLTESMMKKLLDGQTVEVKGGHISMRNNQPVFSPAPSTEPPNAPE